MVRKTSQSDERGRFRNDKNKNRIYFLCTHKEYTQSTNTNEHSRKPQNANTASDKILYFKIFFCLRSWFFIALSSPSLFVCCSLALGLDIFTGNKMCICVFVRMPAENRGEKIVFFCRVFLNHFETKMKTMFFRLSVDG